MLGGMEPVISRLEVCREDFLDLASVQEYFSRNFAVLTTTIQRDSTYNLTSLMSSHTCIIFM